MKRNKSKTRRVVKFHVYPLPKKWFTEKKYVQRKQEMPTAKLPPPEFLALLKKMQYALEEKQFNELSAQALNAIRRLAGGRRYPKNRLEAIAVLDGKTRKDLLAIKGINKETVKELRAWVKNNRW